jgi:hypothetical protein
MYVRIETDEAGEGEDDDDSIVVAVRSAYNSLRLVTKKSWLTY